MINKDSIVTAYDEHLTLVEWLQKVSKALNESVLTNLGIAKLSDQGNIATYRVTATFADNTTIVSDTFTLPSTDIVTAFNNLTTLVNDFDDRITDNTNDVASIIDIIDIGNDKIKASTLQNSINGSDEVIVDIDETNDKLEIHLSTELQAKLARVLLKPSSAPTTRKVVTIDTNGAQDNVESTSLTTLMSNIVDSHGNKRFVEGDINFNSDVSTYFIFQYGKWSLSGTHLMLVVFGTIKENSSFDYLYLGDTVGLPSYVLDKITYSIVSNKVDFKVFNCYADGYSPNQLNCYLIKTADNRLGIETRGDTYTTEPSRLVRIQFDLLIDSE